MRISEGDDRVLGSMSEGGCIMRLKRLAHVYCFFLYHLSPIISSQLSTSTRPPHHLSVLPPYTHP